jgi:hypothetical protein
MLAGPAFIGAVSCLVRGIRTSWTSRGNAMKEIFGGDAAETRKLGVAAFVCCTLAIAFLTGCCIRWLAICGIGFMVRHCIGYLTLLSC